MKKYHKTSLILMLTLLCSATFCAPDHSLYFVGNSLTRGLSLDRLEQLYIADGGSLEFATQTGAGVTLGDNFKQIRTYNGKPFRMGYLENGKNNYHDRFPERATKRDYKSAFQEFQFDGIVLQPYLAFLRPEDYPEREQTKGYLGDIAAARGFIEVALGGNPAGNLASDQFYIYAVWPRLEGMESRQLDPDGNGVYNLYEFYAAPYETHPHGPMNVVPTAAGVEALMAALDDIDGLDEPVRLIPVGAVFAELDQQILTDKLLGVARYFQRNAAYFLKARLDGKTSLAEAKFPFDPGEDGFERAQGIRNFYADRVHMNDQPHNKDDAGTIGAFVAAATIYSVVTGNAPTFTPETVAAAYESFDPAEDAALIEALQATIWRVVQSTPRTGLSGGL